MKKLLPYILLIASVCIVACEDDGINGIGDSEINKNSEFWNVPYDTTATVAGHSYVDIGVSVLWATCNINATHPLMPGSYFAWGETEPNINNNYNWANYQWSNGSGNTLTKYSTDSSYGVVDNKTSLDLEDDAAHVNWGGSWRMPTQTEFQELKDNCTSVWTTENGINGRRYTSNKEGYTDKSIFIPIAGRRDGTQLYNVGAYGYYWTSSLDTSNPSDAYYLYLYLSNERVDYHYSRSNGHPIRPVCE